MAAVGKAAFRQLNTTAKFDTALHRRLRATCGRARGGGARARAAAAPEGAARRVS